MSIRVQVPGAGIVEFPDGTSESDMRDALSKLPSGSAPKAPPRTWTDTAVDAIPSIGGALGGIVGGIGGTVAGMGVGGAPGAIGGAALGGVAGQGLKDAVNYMRGSADTPKTVGESLGDSAMQGGVQGAFEGAGQALGPALQAGGTAIYRGYLKPSLSRVNLPKAAQIVKNAIAESLPVTSGGFTRANELIGQLNAQVNQILDDTAGRTVDLKDIASRVRTWAQKVYNRPGQDPTDLKAALAVADRIDQHPSLPRIAGQTTTESVPSAILGSDGRPLTTSVERSGPETIQTNVGLPAANQVKQDIQTSVGDKFGLPGGTATTRTEKMASNVARRSIERLEPSVGPLNARQQRLLDVAQAIQHAVGREGNQSAVNGVKTMAALVGGGVDYQRRGSPLEAATTALALRAGMTPAVATRAAILAVKLGEKIPAAAASDVARVAVQVASEAEQQPQ